MKFPVAIPRSAFITIVVILAALMGGLIGAMFTLAMRGLPIPGEFGQMLLAIGAALATLIVGPKPRSTEIEEDAADAAANPERPLSD